eukprot:GILK01006304.1.p1 GENE.GILK01006304.1~~GILK01006304.1.p1  ORF type:complete len:532 (+),score=154.84 GILK01006304.1:42-1637(+)
MASRELQELHLTAQMLSEDLVREQNKTLSLNKKLALCRQELEATRQRETDLQRRLERVALSDAGPEKQTSLNTAMPAINEQTISLQRELQSAKSHARAAIEETQRLKLELSQVLRASSQQNIQTTTSPKQEEIHAQLKASNQKLRDELDALKSELNRSKRAESELKSIMQVQQRGSSQNQLVESDVRQRESELAGVKTREREALAMIDRLTVEFHQKERDYMEQIKRLQSRAQSVPNTPSTSVTSIKEIAESQMKWRDTCEQLKSDVESAQLQVQLAKEKEKIAEDFAMQLKQELNLQANRFALLEDEIIQLKQQNLIMLEQHEKDIALLKEHADLNTKSSVQVATESELNRLRELVQYQSKQIENSTTELSRTQIREQAALSKVRVLMQELNIQEANIKEHLEAEWQAKLFNMESAHNEELIQLRQLVDLAKQVAPLSPHPRPGSNSELLTSLSPTNGTPMVKMNSQSHISLSRATPTPTRIDSQSRIITPRSVPVRNPVQEDRDISDAMFGSLIKEVLQNPTASLTRAR